MSVVLAPPLPGRGLRLEIERGCGGRAERVPLHSGLPTPGLGLVGCGGCADVDTGDSTSSNLPEGVDVGLGGGRFLRPGYEDSGKTR